MKYKINKPRNVQILFSTRIKFAKNWQLLAIYILYEYIINPNFTILSDNIHLYDISNIILVKIYEILDEVYLIFLIY